MKLLRKRDTYIDPAKVIWPQYCLGVIPCWRDRQHRRHFWMHPSGYTAVCEGITADPERSNR